MAMGICDDEDFELEVARLEKPTAIIEKTTPKGRASGDNNVPSALRQIIAEEGVEGTSNKELAHAFGVSESSVSAYKHGSTSTTRYGRPDEKLKDVVDQTREKIHRKASRKLMQALTEITTEKLKDSRATDLSAIAANMSRVIEKTSPKDVGDRIQNNIIFVSPTQIHENNYESIDV